MNLSQGLSQTSEKYPDKPAIVLEGRGYTFHEIDEEVRKRGQWLRNKGIQKGDRVALQLPKGMEFIFLHLAILSVGAVTLPLNPAYSAGEIAYALSDSQSCLFFTGSKEFEPLQKTVEGVEGVRTIFVDAPSPGGGDSLLAELAKIGATDSRTYPAQDDDLAMICYTSGTTGKSKGAMITHRNLVTNMLALQKAWEWTDRDVLLHVLPLFHIHGLAVALHGGLHAGSTQILHERFDPRRTWEAIERDKCTLLMAVPTIYYRLLNAWEAVRPDLRAMRLFISGSAPLSKLFLRFAETTGFRILERYGMTEAGMISSNPLEPSKRKSRSVGYPLPGVRIRIVSPGGRDVSLGEVGEVWIQGENVFKGYWQMPEKTGESFEAGWLKSGDLGYQDPQDSLRLYLVGRVKELIITGGYNVYPKEVENILEQHEAIQEAAVIGLPDDDFGERVTAVVVLKKDHPPPPPEAIITFCKRHLASYKCPKQVLWVDQLPRNALGKVQMDIFEKRGAILDTRKRKPPVHARGGSASIF